MINSRKLDDLLPRVKAKAEAFIAKCKSAGIDVLIYSTYRDNESQDALYAQGRSKPGAIVTNSKGGQSFHNYRVAFDFVPQKDGKPQWDDVKLYRICGLKAKEVGLEWGGNWKFQDMPHCQETGGYTIMDFKNHKVPKEWLESKI